MDKTIETFAATEAANRSETTAPEAAPALLRAINRYGSVVVAESREELIELLRSYYD